MPLPFVKSPRSKPKKIMFKTIPVIIIAIAVQFSFGPLVSSADDHKDSSKIKVLLVDGQNNHDWKRCSPVMIETLEATG